MEPSTQFLAKALHILKSPLTIIREGISIVLDGSAGIINTEQVDFLSTAKKQSDRLLHMMNDIFDYQTLCHSSFHLTIEDCNCNHLLETLLEEMHPVITSAGLLVSYTPKGDIPAIKADKTYLLLALRKILINAIQYTHRGGSITIITDFTPAESIVLSVTDTGIGIQEKEIGELMTPFVRFSRPLNPFGGGAGLGLASSKRIIDAHGGSIRIQSQTEKGTTVSIKLPLLERAHEGNGAHA